VRPLSTRCGAGWWTPPHFTRRVFEVEPPSVENHLLQLEQVAVTPHFYTGTLESREEKAAMYADNIRRVLAGSEPVGLLSQAGGAI
jgi:phosphoglycerate dehydrogenase-like enzyme